MSRILLIDDDDSFRKMLRITLTGMGHVVLEARNGREGLAIPPHIQADVVLTDIIMPEKEGLETIIAMRHTRPGARIVAMSGGGRGTATDYLMLAQKLGASAILAKPFSDDELTAALGGAR
jgi:CheY-like chemotaxis protein